MNFSCGTHCPEATLQERSLRSKHWTLLGPFMLILHQGAHGSLQSECKGVHFCSKYGQLLGQRQERKRLQGRCMGWFGYTVQWQQCEQAVMPGQLGRVFVAGISVMFYDSCL